MLGQAGRWEKQYVFTEFWLGNSFEKLLYGERESFKKYFDEIGFEGEIDG
jgi:hypothetical protein